MIHGPCKGTVPEGPPCMHKGQCTKGFPKPFAEDFAHGQGGEAILQRRRPDGDKFRTFIKFFLPPNPAGFVKSPKLALKIRRYQEKASYNRNKTYICYTFSLMRVYVFE